MPGFLGTLFDTREIAEFKDRDGKADPFEIFDYLFFSGDLNFRIRQQEMTLMTMLASKKYEELAKFDELMNLRMYNEDLKRYAEEPIKFPPSYKLKPKSKPLAYECSKGRLPSY
jgi:hypothetical protein